MNNLKNKDKFDYTYLYKICLFADENVGKKTLIKSKFIKIDLDYTDPDILGVTITAKNLEFDEEIIRDHIWIISSRKQFEPLFTNYMHGTLGVILMYDVTNAKSLYRLSEWIKIIKKDYDLPILLVGNKIDLEELREISREQVEKFKEFYNIKASMEISIKTGENVEDMFKNINKMVKSKFNLEIIKE